MQEYGDKEILEMFAGKTDSNKAFRLLVEKYNVRLYWHIRKIVISHDDADDVLQNTFVKVWKGLKNFRYDAELFTWMYRIATNESITFLNNKKKMAFSTGADIEDILLNNLEGDAYFDGNKIEKELQKAILKLPERQRMVFNMKYFDDMKYDEIADVLDVTVGALKASYHHAVKKVQETLKMSEV